MKLAQLFCRDDVPADVRSTLACWLFERGDCEPLLEAIIDHAPLTMVAVDHGRSVRWVNGATVQATSLSTESLLGRRGGEVLRCLLHLDHPEGCGYGPRCQTCPVRVAVLQTLTEGSARTLDAVKLPSAEDRDRLLSMVVAPVRFRSEPMALVCVEDITHRRLDQAALQVSEDRLRSLIEETTDAVFCYEYRPPIPTDLSVEEQIRRLYEGVLAECNLVCARSYGAESTAEVIGRKLTDLFGAEPGGLDRLFRAVVEGGYRVVDGEGVEVLPDGTRRHFLNNAHGVVEEGRLLRIWGTFRDVTDRKQAEDRLRVLSAVIEQTASTVGIVDRRGLVEYLNPAALNVYGARSEQVVGKPWSELVSAHSTLRERMGEIRESVLQRAQPWQGEISDIDRSGQTVWRDALVFPIKDAAGQTTHVAYTSNDITGRKTAEQEGRRLEAQLHHAQKLESLGILAGGIAHDFNNLLVAILGSASLASTSLAGDSAVSGLLGDIETAALRAAELCQQLLAYSGHATFVVEPVDLGRVVAEMVSLIRVSISKKVELGLNLEQRPLAIQADVTQFRQIVLNLIINASEAIGDAVGTVTVSTGVAEVAGPSESGTHLGSSLHEGLYAFVEVSDTGVGMDAETQRRLFDPFFTTKATGRGLGLSAVLGIVVGHQGAIKVDSQPGRGTTFRVLFPLLAPGTSLPRPRVTRTEIADWQGQGTVLVVDDDPWVRTAAQRMIQLRGFKVLSAANGHEGIQAFREHASEIVLVLLDLTMPQLGGEEALRQIRSVRHDVPVVLMSGYSGRETARRLAEQHVQGFVQKPFDTARLLQALRDALEAPPAPGS